MGRRFLIDRKELPYDAMVNDPSWLIPIDEEEEEGDDNAEEEKVQTVAVHVEGLPL